MDGRLLRRSGGSKMYSLTIDYQDRWTAQRSFVSAGHAVIRETPFLLACSLLHSPSPDLCGPEKIFQIKKKA
jgi:hypothetical protein